MTANNPFAAADADRHEIWEMLVQRDTDFFLGGDWSVVADDYVDAGFLGIDAGLSLEPSAWRPTYPTVESYRDAAIAARWNSEDFAEPLRRAWLGCQSIARIDISGNAALAHKHIDGSIQRRTGGSMGLHWRSIFQLRRVQLRWQIAGFTGYLPLEQK